MTTLIIINALVLLSILGVGFYLFVQNTKKKESQNIEMITFRDAVQKGLETSSESLRNDLRHLQDQFGEHMRHQTDVLNKTNTHLNERMDNAASVIGEVKKELGKMSSVARSIDELQSILKAPKLRGGFGELFLGDLLSQILPKEHFDIQYKFKNGELVDAVIYLGEKIVPIDSKFPLENFQKMVDSGEDEIPKQVRRQFINDIKKHIQAVSKYIRVDENTYDFALMYVPAENIYYEVAVKDDVGGETRELLNYALKHKVIPVSPNTLYAYLMTIIVGLRGLQLEKHTEAVLAKMGRIQKDFTGFQKVYSKLGTHLENARKSYEDADKRLDKVDNKLQEFVPVEETASALPSPKSDVSEEIVVQ